MPDLEIVRAFEHQIARNVVHISVQIDGDPSVRYGTGTIFACVSNAEYGNGAFIVTAKHVIEVPVGQEALYSLSRIGPGHNVRQATFRRRSGDTGAGPRAFWYVGKGGLDIGAVIAPARCDDGTPFLANSEFDPSAGIMVGVPLFPRELFLGEGTRVAWAGYPEVAYKVFAQWSLCYYEGVVAHAFNDREYPLYLLDGHNDHGVSGGPVWWWSDKAQRVELVGVITHYCQASLSGFAIATAINPFCVMLESLWKPRAPGELRSGGSPGQG
ncbi:MAG: hypothetical protein AB1716_01285 [Planctomycetota bacterium]